jgi:non-specific serine/threonine protein kinase
MLETLREYAAERLDPVERAALARRHADVFVRLVEKAQTKANGPEEVQWFDRLERERDNVRAAFDWSMSADGDVDIGIRIALASQPFLYRRYRLTEGRIWFEQILARPEQAPKAARARVLNVMGIFAFRQGEWERATAHFEEALSLEREMEDPPAVGALTYLGMIAAEAGEFERARAFHEENLIRQRRIGDSQAIAITLNELGVIAQALGDYDQAAAYLAEAAALSRSRGDQLHVAICLIIQAGLETERGNLDKATELLDEALGLAREGKNQTAVALVAIYYGWVKRHRGEFEAAAASYQEALEFLRSRDDRPGIAGVLEGLAIVAAASSEPARALRLAGAADALRATTHTRPSPAMQRELDESRSVAHKELGEESALEYAAGQAMALDQAILFALTRAAVSGRTRER